MSYCPTGHENPEGSAYCSTCGQPLGAGRAPADSARASAPAEAPLEAPYAPAEGTSQHTTPKKGRLAWIAGGAVLLVGLAAIPIALTFGGKDEPTSGDMIRGIVSLSDEPPAVTGDWDDCEGIGGYSDFGAGMRISVKGADGQIVGTGDVMNVSEENLDAVVQADWDGDEPLGLSETTNMEVAKSELRQLLRGAAEMELACVLYFEADVDPSNYYAIQLGSRSDLSYSRAELEAQGYVVSFALGNKP